MRNWTRERIRLEVERHAPGPCITLVPDQERRGHSRFCVLCLRAGEALEAVTRAHIFNKQQRKQGIPVWCYWSHKRSGVAVIATGLFRNGERVFLGGRWIELSRATVPLCEGCRTREKIVDGVAQRRVPVGKPYGDRLHVSGLPPNATVKKGSCIECEDRRPAAQETVARKTQYFLDAFALVIGLEESIRTIGNVRGLLEQHLSRGRDNPPASRRFPGANSVDITGRRRIVAIESHEYDLMEVMLLGAATLNQTGSIS